MEMGLLTLDGLQSTPLAPRACSHLGRMSFHQKEPRAQQSSPHSTAALCAPLGMRIPGNSSSQSQHSPTLGKRGSHSQGVFWRHLPLDSCSPFSQRIFLQGAEGKPTRGVPAMQPELILSSTQSSGIPSHTQPSLPEPQQIFLGEKLLSFKPSKIHSTAKSFPAGICSNSKVVPVEFLSPGMAESDGTEDNPPIPGKIRRSGSILHFIYHTNPAF